jgi:two-component system, LytTR family, response regulator
MKAIIIDDEQSARTALTELLTEYFPNVVQIVATCDNPYSGIEAIKNHNPDVVFLDVEMPEMTGFEMLKRIDFPNVNFKVIFSTAHGHYAVQAFRHSATDFLLKPVKLEELIEAVMKVKEGILRNQQSVEVKKYQALLENIEKEEAQNVSASRQIVLSTTEGVIFTNSDDVIRLEADGNYTTFHIANARPIFISKKIGDFDERTPFYRVHRSHSVNPKHVASIVSKGSAYNVLMSDGSNVEMARGKKEEFKEYLRAYFNK